METCLAQGCDSAPKPGAKAYGWCVAHWGRWYKGTRGARRPYRIAAKPCCIALGCSDPAMGRTYGWCSKHYSKWAHGSRGVPGWHKGKGLAERVRHGRAGTYTNHGCRCVPCTLAASENSLRGIHARRARLALAVAVPYSRTEIFRRDRGICHLCLEPVSPARWHLDHIVPIARGGADAPWNVAVSHPYCNRQKGARLLDKPA